jgi:FixJ family two-component response regulator
MMLDTQGKQAAKPLVAIVDDDPSFLRSMCRMLRIAGYNVGAFASPGDFLKSLPASLPQCLVVDMHMPEMTGIELQDRLLAEGFCVPAILVTAHDTEQTREQARRRGFSGLLLKPFDGEILLGAIEKLSAHSVAGASPQVG